MRSPALILLALTGLAVAACDQFDNVLPGGPDSRFPADFDTICRANVGSPETQIAGFRASGRYGEPVVSTFDTGAQFVIFKRPGLEGAGATVTTGATGANGCSVIEAGIEYTLTPSGQIYTDRAEPEAFQ